MRERDKQMLDEDLIVAEYLRELTLAKRRTANAKSGLRIFFEYMARTGLDYRRLRARDAQAFQEHLTTQADEDDGAVHYRKASVAQIVGRLTAFYEYLRRRKLAPSNPFKAIVRVRTERALPRNILDEAKLAGLLRHLRNWNAGRDVRERRRLYRAHVISELMYSTGARIDEIAKLRPEDIDFDRGLVRVEDSKRCAIRAAILNSYAEKVLRLYVERLRECCMDRDSNRELLFGSRSNIKLAFNRVLNRESRSLGLGEFTSHNFRHCVGYHLLRGGCDIRYIQDILGHKELYSTQVYTKVDREDLRNVIDAYHPRRRGSIK